MIFHRSGAILPASIRQCLRSPHTEKESRSPVTTSNATQHLTIPQLFDLTGQVAIVTGAALGIGQAIAYRLAEAGAAVVIADINLEAAQATVERIASRGGKALAIRADAASVADAHAVAKAAVDTFDRLHILVNNAGIYPLAPALQVTEAQWDRVLDINLKGALFYAQAAAKQMIAVGHGGRIVNIASVDGLHPTGQLTHYDASKGGLIMLTKSLAQELGPHRIAVNAVAPGGINTPGTAVTYPAALQQPAPEAPEPVAGDDFLRRILMGRMGEPDEIATVVLFLLSRAASYMTGSLVVVDGGYLVG
jgi:2-dehydro-3-deoxy-D-gluconate 5-dehydrogenase